MAPSPSFSRIEPFVRSELVEWYRQTGDLEFAFAAGSLVEGFTDDADLDLTFVWNGGAPARTERLPTRLIDPSPLPEQFEQPNFNLDRFWVDGQQLDVKHATVDDLHVWVEEVDTGEGTTAYPMPVIVMHTLTTGIIMFDHRDRARDLHERLTPPSARYVTAVEDRWSTASTPYLEELDMAAARGDGLLFDHLAVEAVRIAFIAWFARQGLYWPHEKRLNVRLRQMGFDDIAVCEQRVWSAPGLRDRLDALMSLAGAMFPE